MAVDTVATNAFKADPFGFLDDNLILAPMRNALQPNKSEHLALENELTKPGQGHWTATVGGSPGGLYRVVKAGGSPAYFRSYIADYEQGTTVFTTLGTNPNTLFCFTVNMNGCTFGVGSQAGGAGALLVSHGNAANTGLHNNFDTNLQNPQGSNAIQTSLQYSRAKAGHGVGGTVFEPNGYRENNHHSVTFMHRRPGQVWVLYSMRYQRGIGGAYTTPGVVVARTNNIE